MKKSLQITHLQSLKRLARLEPIQICIAPADIGVHHWLSGMYVGLEVTLTCVDGVFKIRDGEQLREFNEFMHGFRYYNGDARFALVVTV